MRFKQLLEAHLLEIVNGKIAAEFAQNSKIAGDVALRNLQVFGNGRLGPAPVNKIGVGQIDDLAAGSKLLTGLSFHAGDSRR